MLNSAVSSVQHQITLIKIAPIKEHVLPLYDLTMLNSADHVKVADIQEHVLYLCMIYNRFMFSKHDLKLTQSRAKEISQGFPLSLGISKVKTINIETSKRL